MGQYVNRGNAMFIRARRSQIYIDKSDILKYLNSVIFSEQEYVCVSRPRRFGKSMTLNMIAAFYDKTCDAEEDFRGLSILKDSHWKDYANRYNVIYLNIQNFVSESFDIEECLHILQTDLTEDLMTEFPGVSLPSRKTLSNVMSAVFHAEGIPFVIVIDEWDCLFREYRNDFEAQKKYLDFLRSWLKDRDYVGLCYMTGILPIKKYGTHSALNMFSEFSMENPGQLAEYTGFTEAETRELCQRYHMNFAECKAWYDGYSFPQCQHIYSPKSVVDAMLSGTFDDYWNRTETYEALKGYIDMNFDGLRDSIVAMIAGDHIRVDTGSFQNDMTTFHNADDVLTLLIHLGYLGYDFEKKETYIPNREITAEFITATSVSGWDEIIRSVQQSAKLLRDTWAGNQEAVAEGIQKAHLETSHLQYNDENALSYTISLAYYAAREYYSIFRELPAGKGFADIVMIPRAGHMDKPAMILELKYNRDADTAIRQILRKEYPEALKDYRGDLLLVGINYDKKTRRHSCRIEKMRLQGPGRL